MNQENLETLNDTSQSPENKGGLLNSLGSFVPFLPVMFEQWTGQKLPLMTGTFGEMHQGITQLNANLQVVINNQNKIWQKLTNLENNASQKLVNLTNKIDKISTVKLTHETERKQIEYGSQPRLKNQEY